MQIKKTYRVAEKEIKHFRRVVNRRGEKIVYSTPTRGGYEVETVLDETFEVIDLRVDGLAA